MHTIQLFELQLQPKGKTIYRPFSLRLYFPFQATNFPFSLMGNVYVECVAVHATVINNVKNKHKLAIIETATTNRKTTTSCTRYEVNVNKAVNQKNSLQVKSCAARKKEKSCY